MAEEPRYVRLPSAPPAVRQQQQQPGGGAASLSPPPAADGGGAGASTSSSAAVAKLQALGRRLHAAGTSGAGAASVLLPDPQKAAQRSRSAGKMPVRPLADGKAAPRNNKMLLPSQMPAQLRQRDKLVLLPRSASEQHEADAVAAAGWPSVQQQLQQHQLSDQPLDGDYSAQQQPASSLFVDLAEVLPDSKGRVTVYCIAESLNRAQLEAFAASQVPDAALASHAEVLHMALPVPSGSEPADCFFFDYGCCCFWGLSVKQEQDILTRIAKKAQEQPLPPREIEIDKFEYNYSTAAPPSMQNDTITISRHHANDPAVKLAICHALAQSTKLCIHEERVLELVLETKHLPQSLAAKGTVNVTAEEVAQRIGQVFIQRAAVNLLGSVLDTPEFFWSAPDQLQTLYERACDYLELARRVEVLNARFTVLQGMLDMLRDHIANTHSVRVEVIIIWLIAVELVVGVVELLGLWLRPA